MRKSIAALPLLGMLLATPAGAALIYQEQFGSDGAGTRYTVTGGGQSPSGQDYWRRSNGGFNPGFTGSSGTFWAGRDLDESFGGGVLPRAVQQMSSSAVNLAAWTGVTMSILLAANPNVWENTQPDVMRLYLVDYSGGPNILLDTFAPTGAVDTSLRSTTFGTTLGTAFVRYTYAVPLTIGNVGFRFEASSGGDLEYIGFDDIQFNGTAVPEPTSAALLAFGLVLIGAARRMRSR